MNNNDTNMNGVNPNITPIPNDVNSVGPAPDLTNPMGVGVPPVGAPEPIVPNNNPGFSQPVEPTMPIGGSPLGGVSPVGGETSVSVAPVENPAPATPVDTPVTPMNVQPDLSNVSAVDPSANLAQSAPVNPSFDNPAPVNPAQPVNNASVMPEVGMQSAPVMSYMDAPQAPSVDAMQTSNVSPMPSSVDPTFPTNGIAQNNPMAPNVGMSQNNIHEIGGMNPNMNMQPNNFGGVPTPPVVDNGGKKKGGNLKLSKPMILVIVLLLVAVVGGGVYFVLKSGQDATPQVNFTVNSLMFQLGEKLPTDAASYVSNLVGAEASSCKVDTSSVDINKMNTYDFTVTCGGVTKSGKLVLKDSTAPIVALQEVMVVPGTVISLENFIAACSDYTACSYELADKTVNLDELVQNVGTYQFEIIVSDEYDNTTTVKPTLIVTESAPVRYTNCTMTPTVDEELNANVTISYNYGISSEDNISKMEKIYVYQFDLEEDYLAVKSAYDANTGIHGVVGSTVFDDMDFEITVTAPIQERELATEFNVSSFPQTYEELRNFNIEQGISCRNR